MVAQWFNSFYWPDSTPRAFSTEQKHEILKNQDYHCIEDNCDEHLAVNYAEILILRNYVDGKKGENCKGIALCKNCYEKMTQDKHNDWLELCV